MNIEYLILIIDNISKNIFKKKHIKLYFTSFLSVHFSLLHPSTLSQTVAFLPSLPHNFHHKQSKPKQSWETFTWKVPLPQLNLVSFSPYRFRRLNTAAIIPQPSIDHKIHDPSYPCPPHHQFISKPPSKHSHIDETSTPSKTLFYY